MATETISDGIYKTFNESGSTGISIDMNGSLSEMANLNEKAPRPPNRKRNEEQLAELTSKIKELEDAKQKYSEKLRVVREQVNSLRDRRDQISGQKYDVDEKWNVITKSVETKKDALQRLKAAFVVTSEDALDQQIRALQNDLHKNHFKLTEERRIVAEIDKLNRSRRAIKEYNMVKEEVEELKLTQKELREQRDLMFRERGDLKRKEDDAKNEMRELRDSTEDMKIKIETYVAEKRNITAEFRLQEMAHKKYISERREEAKLKRKEEKEAAEAQKMKEWEEIKANEEPFEKERALVATLIVYCQKLDPNLSDGGSDENSSSKNSSIEIGDDFRLGTTAPENCTFYRKKDEDDMLFAGVKKSNKSNKKSAKKQKARNLKHNPETYMQFSSLSLKPPSTSKDIPDLLEKLKSKKIFFEDLAGQEKAARLLKEPSPLVDYLSDDLVISGSGSGGTGNGSTEDQHNRPMMISNKINKKKEMLHNVGQKNGGTFNIDQFPSLPQPASKNGSIFDRDTEW